MSFPRAHCRRLCASILPEEFRPSLNSKITLRAMPGPQADYFDEGLEIFFNTEFEVASQADRMGYRLTGPVMPLKKGMPKTIISEPSVPGAIELPRPTVNLLLKWWSLLSVGTPKSPQLSLRIWTWWRKPGPAI